MKFLLFVIAIHFIGEMISTKRKRNKINEAGKQNEPVHHPAEFELR